MKKLRKLLLLLCLMVAGMQGAWAQDVTYNGVKFTYYNMNGECWAYVIGIEGTTTEITVPATINPDGDKDIPVRGLWYNVTNNYVKKLIVNSSYFTIEGTLKSSSLQSITFNGEVNIPFKRSSWHNDDWTMNYSDYNAIDCAALSTIQFNGKVTIAHGGNWAYYDDNFKLISGNVPTIKAPNLIRLDFYGDIPTLPTYDGTFSEEAKGKITAYVHDLTTNEVNALKSSTTAWNNFKTIVSVKMNANYAFTTDGKASLSLYWLSDNPEYTKATSKSLVFQSPKKDSWNMGWGTVKMGKNYALVVENVPSNKTMHLTRNGQTISPIGPTSGQYYYNEAQLQADVTYGLTFTDKTCDLTLTQTGYRGNITYTKTVDNVTSSAVVYTSPATITCAQGGTLELSIPYDQYIPSTLEVNGTSYTLKKENGRATATINVPSQATAAGTLTWAAPAVTYSQPPKVMVMRSGEGNVLFKGAMFLDSSLQQYIDEYEQDGLLISKDDNGSWVVSGNGPVNCSQAVTSVTVPDVDPRGDGLEEGYWGFVIEITPVAGQTLKTLMIGHISGDNELIWEDMLHGDLSDGNYVTYNASTNTYKVDVRGDYMNFGPSDQIVNIAMGPEESTIETGATLNFVRKGGRTEVLFEKEDCDGTLTDQAIEEGSTTFKLGYFTEAELDDAGMSYYQMLLFNPVEGEAIRVFCDGQDVTSQMVYPSKGNPYLNLERKNHTYSILIDESPDANPKWNITKDISDNVLVNVTLKDGTSQEYSFSGLSAEKTFSEPNISWATLKVPLTYKEGVSGYQIYLKSYDSAKKLQVVKCVKELIGDLKTAKDLVDAAPVILNEGKEYTDLDDAQAAVDELAAVGAEAEIRTVTIGSTSIVNDRPVRVLRNGEDVTAQMYYSGDYAEMHVSGDALVDAVWQILYDTTHRQTFIRKGGAENDVEVGYYYGKNNEEHSFHPDAVGTPLNVDFPAYHVQNAANTFITINQKAGKSITVLRNGVDVTDVFAQDGYSIYEFEHADADGNTLAELGFELRDPAVWEITIEDANKLLYAYAGNGTIAMKKIKANGEIDNQGGGLSHSYHWVEKGEGMQVLFFPSTAGSTLTKLVLNGDLIDIENDDRLVKEGGYYVLTLSADYFNTFTSSDNKIHVFAEFAAGNIKTNTIANPDGMEITFVTKPKDGEASTDTFSAGFYQLNYDDSDREKYESVTLRVPVGEGTGYRPVRVLRNGEDVTYEFKEYNTSEGYFAYDISLNADVTWDISYDTNHRQAFIAKGGTYAHQVAYDYATNGREHYFRIENDGTPTHVDFPARHTTHAQETYVFVDYSSEDAGKTWKVLRNGEDVTDKFVKYSDSGYILRESRYVDSNGSTLEKLGFEFRDPAVWEITLENARAKYDTNGDGQVTIADVTKLVNVILGKE